MKRRLAVALACGLVGLTLAAPTAQAARSGPLTVEVEAVFGSPLPSGFAPFTGEAVFSGVVDLSEILVTGLFGPEPHGVSVVGIAGARGGNGTGVEGPAPPSELVCSAAGPIGCLIAGGLIGFHGRLIFTAVELREGGRFAFRIDFPVVFCPLCPAR